MNDTSITTWIAIYGAVLSSIVLVWNIFRDLTDKGRLDVFCYIGKIVAEKGPTDTRDYLVYNVTNCGRRPIMVIHVGGDHRSGQFVVLPRKLPKMLQPGEFLLELSHDLSVLNEDLISLWALDSLGKKHKVKDKALKDLVAKQNSKKLNEAKG